MGEGCLQRNVQFPLFIPELTVSAVVSINTLKLSEGNSSAVTEMFWQ